jgi:hypothetical protein
MDDDDDDFQLAVEGPCCSTSRAYGTLTPGGRGANLTNLGSRFKIFNVRLANTREWLIYAIGYKCDWLIYCDW